ncbi:hypothetical protein GMA3_17 [Gordonia phage GMA3]|uniref:Minor tail protein n=1 Tax=Gordonia phage GMA3 TaxID=1647284 RepID=A0A0K0NKU0_9CAUD|nr:minor tail protein [Gordonia phage GMA3]AKL88194.1 hypothetical protein GMA3_17 [Gordonia phage GMA3]
MGRYYWRPNVAAAVDYGNVDTDGSGTVLGDNSDSTRKKYFDDSGSILTFNLPSPSVIPLGREIIAVRVGHRQVNDLLLFNGWPRSYLRINGKAQANTVAYKQDGYSGSAREILGAALYNKNLAPWSWADCDTMGAETGAAKGEIGPNKGNRWCIATEVFIQLVYNDPVPVPSAPYPANNENINTSSVQFSAKAPASQSEQPVRTVFQVSRVNTFDDDDVRTFVGGLNDKTASDSRSYYVSDPLAGDGSSYTNLGPGTWFMRIKNRDFRNSESAWGATTSFNIVHGPLPGATLIDPVRDSVINSPYKMRGARIATQPQGGRRVGVTWQFATDENFTENVVQWTNSSGGTFVANVDNPFDIYYDPKPRPETESGKHGPTVGVDDPTQYLKQGIWYGRVRATDVYGQSGTWSGSLPFTVTHPPVPRDLIPTGGVSFDQAEAPVKWQFGDPWTEDYQTSYRMRVYDQSNNLVQDTDKTVSGLSRATMSVPGTLHRQMLTIAVDIWDADDIPSASVNQLVGICRLSTAPQTTLTFPGIDETIVSGQPNFTWTSVFAAAGIMQKSFQIKVKEIATGKQVYDSGVIITSAESHMPTRPILKNLFGYQVALTVVDSENLGKTIYQNFATNFERPEIVVATEDHSSYMSEGYVTVNWPSGNPDPFFKEWRIYRKRADETDDQYILAGVVNDSSVKTFDDWLIAGNDNFVYSVVQVAYRFGSPVESEHNPTAQFYVYSENYWLIVEDKPELNIRVAISADRYTDNREMADYNIINGGRRRAYGTKYGKSGNLTAKIRHSNGMSASMFIRKMGMVADNNHSVYMRDPFGGVTLIGLGELSFDRLAGVGESEYGDLDIPYIEVGRPDFNVPQ